MGAGALTSTSERTGRARPAPRRPPTYVYTAAFATSELIRVDRTTGAACLLVSGLATPTNVRFALNFGTASPTRDMYPTEASGSILRITLNG